MLYKINNKITLVNPLLFIGNGSQGRVYQNKEKAVKIYYNIYTDLDYIREKDEQLSNISTKYIILPEEGVFNLTGRYRGYQMEYIDLDKTSNKKILNTTKADLNENLLQLEEDANAISKANFYMFDITSSIHFNGKFYVFGTNIYFNTNLKNSLFFPRGINVQANNLDVVKSGICNLINREMMLNDEEKQRVIFLFSNIQEFGEKLGDGETIKQYILRK